MYERLEIVDCSGDTRERISRDGHMKGVSCPMCVFLRSLRHAQVANATASGFAGPLYQSEGIEGCIIKYIESPEAES